TTQSDSEAVDTVLDPIELHITSPVGNQEAPDINTDHTSLSPNDNSHSAPSPLPMAQAESLTFSRKRHLSSSSTLTGSIPIATDSVVERHHKKRPVFTEGRVTPKQLSEWRHACADLFTEQNVAEAEKVANVLSGLQQHRVCKWVNGNREHLVKLAFDLFCTEFAEKFLHPDWHRKICRKIIQTQWDYIRTRWTDYSNHIIGLNSIIEGTALYFKRDLTNTDNDPLCSLFCACLNLHILTRLDNEKEEPTDFEKWIFTIGSYNDERHVAEERQCEIFQEEQRCAAKKSTMVQQFNSGSYSRNSSSSTPYSCPSLSSSRPSSAAGPCLPPLTEDKKWLLMTNEGCFKCRHVFVFCRTKNCSNAYSNTSKYSTLTQDYVHAVKKSCAQAAKPRPVALVAWNHDPLIASTLNAAPTASIAAVLPNLSGSLEGLSFHKFFAWENDSALSIAAVEAEESSGNSLNDVSHPAHFF
ncbi:hypothetical protein H0H93_002213, partial [Arthromyces matolae]